MLEKIQQEMEHELDRGHLYKDWMTNDILELALRRWIRMLGEGIDQLQQEAAVATCIDHQIEINELRSAVATYEERIRQVKEIL